MSIASLAAAVGVNPATLYRKIGTSGEAFTIKEVNAVVKILNLTADEASAIFFADAVAYPRPDPQNQQAE